MTKNLFLQDRESILETFRKVNVKSRQLYQQITNDETYNPFKNKHEILQYLLNNIGSGNFSLISLLDEYLMNPDENNFRLVDIADIPVKVFDENLFTYINETTADALSIEIPEEILNSETTVLMK